MATPTKKYEYIEFKSQKEINAERQKRIMEGYKNLKKQVSMLRENKSV